ncbi:hypothetical protein R1sor_018211 [Riccia sorocarpa]|uniref:WW domain-containing protein n=1 Tax=Riccia sorocarpa TaxID=122646 RepID=A0ABD3IF88_9MARC
MMAVAMEVGWHGTELGSPSFAHLKHKTPSGNKNTNSSSSSWGGADPQKLLQLMMGQIQEESRPTLDLFDKKSSLSVAEADSDHRADAEFVELDPDLPLPSGWEKCLDLKSGKVYYVNRHTGAESRSDPRKLQQVSSTMPEVLQVASASPRTRDFLGSREAETEKLGETSSASARSLLPSFSGRGIDKEKELSESTTTLFSNGKRDKWGGHGWLSSGSSLTDRLLIEVGGADSGLDLKLNLQGKTQQSSVCTLEKVEMALMRSEKMLGKRVASTSRSSPAQPDQLLRGNHSAAHLSPSPSTSSSSTSTSSRPPIGGYQLLDKENQNSNKRHAAGAAAAATTSPVLVANEGESAAQEMVMVGGCKNCAMFVMLSKSNPSCPRCGTSAALDFSSPPLPSSKRTKFEMIDRHE